MKIVTATGKEYQVVWCGISSLDSALRFELQYKNITAAVNVFSDPNETSEIKYIVDEMSQPQFYEGYTNFVSINKASGNTLIIALKQS